MKELFGIMRTMKITAGLKWGQGRWEDDVAQEAAVEVLSALARGSYNESKGSVGAWGYQTALHSVRDSVRRWNTAVSTPVRPRKEYLDEVLKLSCTGDELLVTPAPVEGEGFALRRIGEVLTAQGFTPTQASWVVAILLDEASIVEVAAREKLTRRAVSLLVKQAKEVLADDGQLAELWEGADDRIR